MDISNGHSLDFLPEALVEELLTKNNEVIHRVRSQLKEISALKYGMRQKLGEIGILRNINDLVIYPNHTTTVGIDGTYSIIKQLSVDTVAIAAVAVEGLIPPKETGPWSKPQHRIMVLPLSHNNNTGSLCRAIMFSYELELATKAPHDVVFLDGSFVTYLIGISQGLYAARRAEENQESPIELVEIFNSRLKRMLDDFLKITSSSSDKIYAGMPKYSSGKSVINYLTKFGFNRSQLTRFNDKGLLSLVLKTGDVIGPIRLSYINFRDPPIEILPHELRHYKAKIVETLKDIYTVLLKPSSLQPALRAEIGGKIALNPEKLPTLLDAIQEQSIVPGIIEPYPNYIADLFVKQIHGSFNELREAALSEIGVLEGIDFQDVYLFMHPYRSEVGYGQ